LGYGEDFGIDPDPAAIVAVHYYNGGYVLDEKLYQTQLLNEHLTASLKGMAKAPIVADSAEPKSIAEQQQAGLNVIAAEKGPDSVRAGIKKVQGMRISQGHPAPGHHFFSSALITIPRRCSLAESFQSLRVIFATHRE
jgi:phage terminase large subunit